MKKLISVLGAALSLALSSQADPTSLPGSITALTVDTNNVIRAPGTNALDMNGRGVANLGVVSGAITNQFEAAGASVSVLTNAQHYADTNSIAARLVEVGVITNGGNVSVLSSNTVIEMAGAAIAGSNYLTTVTGAQLPSIPASLTTNFTATVNGIMATGSVATATTVTGSQSNLIATALQSVPTTYALKTDATNAAIGAVNSGQTAAVTNGQTGVTLGGNFNAENGFHLPTFLMATSSNTPILIGDDGSGVMKTVGISASNSTLFAGRFVGSGSGLTNLHGSQVSGAVAMASNSPAGYTLLDTNSTLAASQLPSIPANLTTNFSATVQAIVNSGLTAAKTNFTDNGNFGFVANGLGGFYIYGNGDGFINNGNGGFIDNGSGGFRAYGDSAFYGNGGGLTNLPGSQVSGAVTMASNSPAGYTLLDTNSALNASHLTGTLPAAVISASGVVTNLPLSNGTNDTAMFQSALNSGATYINCAAFQSYKVGNLFATNGPVVINGNFATLNFLAGYTNAILNTGVNTVGITGVNIIMTNSVSIQQLYFNGGDMQNYTTTASIPIPPNNFDTTTIFRNKRSGLYFSCAGGGYLKDCWFQGFSGYGVAFNNRYGTTAYTSTNVMVSGLYGDHNFISFELPGNGFSDTNALGFAYDTPEYLQLENCIAKNSGVGFMMSAGNTKLQNCQATICQFGYMAQGGPNSQHGSIDNMTLNHNTYPFLLMYGGNRFHGLVMYANGYPGLIMNGAIVTFSGGCTWSKTTYPIVLLTNCDTFPSYWSRAAFIGNELELSSITNLVGVASTNALVYFGGNFDPYGSTDFTSAKGLGMITNSTGTGKGTVSYGGLDGSMIYGTLTNNTTGNATAATNDSAGNNISTFYYPTSNPSAFISSVPTTYALKTDATNAANTVYSNNPSGYLITVPVGATNQFVGTNSVISIVNSGQTTAALTTQLVTTNTIVAFIVAGATNPTSLNGSYYCVQGQLPVNANTANLTNLVNNNLNITRNGGTSRWYFQTNSTRLFQSVTGADSPVGLVYEPYNNGNGGDATQITITTQTNAITLTLLNGSVSVSASQLTGTLPVLDGGALTNLFATKATNDSAGNNISTFYLPAGRVNTGTTNAVTLTSFTATFTTAFTDTNYTATATGNGFAVAGEYVSNKTTTNCVFNMSVATGLIDWLVVHQ